MSCTIRAALHKKVAKSLRSVPDTTKFNIASQLSLQANNTGEYTFSLPLKLYWDNNKDEVQDILTNDMNIALNNIRTKDHTILFDLSRENYIKQLLENNFDHVEPPKFVNDSKNIIVEFSSPNIAKPFHLGHLRSTIIGNYVANLNSFFKNSVKKINYLGDWGPQYGLVQLGIGIANISTEEMKNDPIRALYKAYVSANKCAENDSSILDKARNIFSELETGSSTAYEEWESVKEHTVKELTRTYNRIGITFDEYQWESMYNIRNTQPIIALMEKMHLLTLDNEKRKVVQLEKGENIPILKSDGSTLYITRDIAAAIDRFEKNKFDLMYYVVDSSQAKHFSRLIKILEKMDFPWTNNLKHISFGRITGMSTRKGTAVFLDDFLNESKDIMREKQKESLTTKVSMDINDNSADILAVSSLITYDFCHKRNRDYVFDWNVACNVNMNTGIKLQYCHCRLVSLEENSGATLVCECDPTLLTEPEVHNLIATIGKFEEVLLKSFETLEPSLLVNYLLALSQVTNTAINVLQVKGQPSDIANQRLLLFHTSKNVLACGMKLLGITPLNKM